MKHKILFAIPFLLIIDSITTYIGLNYFNLIEANTFMQELAGTQTHIFVNVIMAVMLLRLIYLEIKTEQEWYSYIGYYIVAIMLFAVQINNVVLILL